MSMVEVKTSELIGAALDWAVAYGLNGEPAFFDAFGARMLGRSIAKEVINGNIRPSTDWSQGGPLIEKYKLDIGAPMETHSGPWNANTEWGHPLGQRGDTPLIAACRAIAAAKLGETVNVPAELL